MELGPLERQVLSRNGLSAGRLQQQIRGITRGQRFQAEGEQRDHQENGDCG